VLRDTRAASYRPIASGILGGTFSDHRSLDLQAQEQALAERGTIIG
jgi:hypothetical protein